MKSRCKTDKTLCMSISTTDDLSKGPSSDFTLDAYTCMSVMVHCNETQLDWVTLYFYRLYLVCLEDLTKKIPILTSLKVGVLSLEFDANYACIHSVKLCMNYKQYNI